MRKEEIYLDLTTSQIKAVQEVYKQGDDVNTKFGQGIYICEYKHTHLVEIKGEVKVVEDILPPLPKYIIKRGDGIKKVKNIHQLNNLLKVGWEVVEDENLINIIDNYGEIS